MKGFAFEQVLSPPDRLFLGPNMIQRRSFWVPKPSDNLFNMISSSVEVPH